MSPPMRDPPSRNVVDALRHRQFDTSYNRELETQWYVTPEFIRRLRMWDQLEGHTGCVNCLQWNESGTILASGSDDFQVILWDPFNRRKIRSIQTGHTNNIFSVQFAPERNDRLIISAAGDGKVRVHDISGVSGETLQVYSCHFARVKRLAVTPLEPNIVLSAGEDGVIMQFDLRAPATCQDICSHVLVNLNAHVGPEAEVKCVALNPRRPEMMAVGSNDPFVRVYDRRMLGTKRIRITPVSGRDRPVWDRQAILSLALDDENYDFPMSAVQYYVAGHLPVKYREMRRRLRPLASTYITFSPSGNDLLVNLGGEQIYLFDINGRRRSLLADLKKYFSRTDNVDGTHSNGLVSNGLPLSSATTNGFSRSFTLSATMVSGGSNGESKRRTPLPPRAELLKQRANSCFEKRDFNIAVMLYSQAALIAPKAPIIFANRAAAYMKRNWDGDVYAALRDCYATLILDPDHLKAHFRLARCLHLLSQHGEARMALDMFMTKFPDQAKTAACMELDEGIKKALNSNSNQNQSARAGSGSGSLSDIDTGDNSAENSATGADTERHSRTDDSSDQELALQELAGDYDRRFCGHCNTTTDIKEANFFGPNGEYIIAGSDDGRFFIWERRTCSIVRILQGDESIVNCLQPHPTQCFLATSGIESTVKLWCPMPEDGTKDPRVVLDTEFDSTALQNQRRMNTDPLEIMLQNMGYRLSNVADPDDSHQAAVQCNQS